MTFGVNVASTSTKEVILPTLIGDPTNHKLVVEHDSLASLPSGDALSICQPTNQVQQPLLSCQRSHHFVSKLESCSHNQVQMSSCSQKSWRSAHTNYIRTHHCPDRKATNILWAWCMWVTKNLHLLTLCQRQVVHKLSWNSCDMCCIRFSHAFHDCCNYFARPKIRTITDSHK